MKKYKILRAIGNIDDDLIERCGNNVTLPIASGRRLRWLKWVAPVAACLIITITIPMLLKQPQGDISDNFQVSANATQDSDSTSVNAAVPSPGLSLDREVESEACYAALEDWRGLPTENYVLNEQTNGIAADRMVYRTLEDLAEYADAFILVPGVHETSQDGENMQTSIAEYAETIGNRLDTREWDDSMVSTGSRILIRQQLIGGCSFDEPNNLLRKGGVYLLPVTFNPDWGAYEIAGDIDVLFELNDEGKIVSHSIHEGFNKYDGKPFNELLDDVRALSW